MCAVMCASLVEQNNSRRNQYKLDDELLAPRILFTSTFAAHSSSMNVNLLLRLYIYPQVQPEPPYHF